MQKTNSRHSLIKSMKQSGKVAGKKSPRGIKGNASPIPNDKKIRPGKKGAKNPYGLQVPAHELFNLFTADIIKKKTVFTR